MLIILEKISSGAYYCIYTLEFDYAFKFPNDTFSFHKVIFLDENLSAIVEYKSALV